MAIITQPIQKIAARIAHITQPKTGKWGPYSSVLFLRNDKPLGSEDAKVWKSFKPHEMGIFKVNMNVQLIPAFRNGKETWDIELIHNPQPTPTTPPATAQQNPEALMGQHHKRDIAKYIDEMGNLYAHCYSVALAKLPDGTNDAQVQAMTSSMFIAAKSKFRLEV